MSSGSQANPLVSVLTPTVRGREQLLRECKASVKSQTYKPVEHLIRIDTDRDGCARTMNLLAQDAKGTWLLPLADDDLLLPACIETLIDKAGDADVVYPRPLVWGEPPEQFLMSPPGIPSLAVIRSSLWKLLGGYSEKLDQTEDRDLWERALERRAVFVLHDESPTWVYRFHGGNKSRGQLA